MPIEFSAGSGGDGSNWNGNYTITLGATASAGQTIVVLCLSSGGINQTSGYTILCQELVDNEGSPVGYVSAQAKLAIGGESTIVIDGIEGTNGRGIGFLVDGEVDFDAVVCAASYTASTIGTAPSVDSPSDGSLLIAGFFDGSNWSTTNQSRGVFRYQSHLTIFSDDIDSGPSGTTTNTNDWSQAGAISIVLPPVATGGGGASVSAIAGALSCSAIASGSALTAVSSVVGRADGAATASHTASASSETSAGAAFADTLAESRLPGAVVSSATAPGASSLAGVVSSCSVSAAPQMAAIGAAVAAEMPVTEYGATVSAIVAPPSAAALAAQSSVCAAAAEAWASYAGCSVNIGAVAQIVATAPLASASAREAPVLAVPVTYGVLESYCARGFVTSNIQTTLVITSRSR